jgi:hypothetical protein
MIKRINSFLVHHTSRLVDESERELRLPKYVLWITLFISYNVLFQGVLDLILKIMSYTPYLYFPMRIDFIFLTMISVLMGYQTLVGMRRRELDMTRNSVLLGLLTEISLVVSDVIHMIEYSHLSHLVIIRTPFVFLTIINFCLLVYLSRKINLFRDDNGKFTLV